MSYRRFVITGGIVFALLGVLAAGVSCFVYNGKSIDEPPCNTGPVTYSHDVAPIVLAKCSSCHRPSDAAPFGLLTYDDVSRRGRQIVDVTQKRFMPPWLPKEGHGDFANVRRLTTCELDILKRWVESGMPRGDESEIPAAPVVVDRWKTSPPDLVLESPAYTLSSDDRDVFRNFVLPLDLKTPKWIQSIEIRPLNPRVTHHARLGVDSSNESLRRDAEDAEPGYAGMAWAQDPDGQLVIWAPGMAIGAETPGVAWRLYPKSCLVLHTHMQPSGKSEIVQFQVGIRYAKQPPERHPAMLRIGSCNIDIPAGARHHVVDDRYVLPIDVDVHTIFPHAHSLCRDVSVVAELPDGSRKPLISIDRFDENWHDLYAYQRPVRLPRGTQLVSKFAYDNSEENVRNRNRPPRRVVYGSNANDEMADIYLQVTPVRADQRAALMEHYKRYEMQSQFIGYSKALEMYPQNPWMQEGLATAYVGLGEPKKAIPILEQRVKTDPKAVFPLAGLGLAVGVSGDSARAETLQRQAIALDDNYPLAWFGLGKALATQKKSDQAEEAFRRAAELAPGMLEAHLDLADVLIQRGELKAAADVCSAALDSAADKAKLHLKLAEIAAKEKNYEGSLAQCRKAYQEAPYTHPPKVLLAVFCISGGEQELGLKYLRAARVEFPKHPMPPFLLGQIARRQQQWNEARSDFAAAASLPTPDNWPASHKQRFVASLHSERLQLAQQLQDLDLARDVLWQWMQDDPDNQKVRKMYEGLPRGPSR